MAFWADLLFLLGAGTYYLPGAPREACSLPLMPTGPGFPSDYQQSNPGIVGKMLFIDTAIDFAPPSSRTYTCPPSFGTHSTRCFYWQLPLASVCLCLCDSVSLCLSVSVSCVLTCPVLQVVLLGFARCGVCFFKMCMSMGPTLSIPWPSTTAGKAAVACRNPVRSHSLL